MPKNDFPDGTTYDAQDITVLEGLEAVRKRPGMYIGSTGVRGLHHPVYEIVDNSLDEAPAGRNDIGEGGGYKVSGGLHGVGASVVNALSEELHVEVRRDGHIWTQDYVRGAKQNELSKGAALAKSDLTGTSVTFLPDAEIFQTTEFDF